MKLWKTRVLYCSDVIIFLCVYILKTDWFAKTENNK